MRGGGDENRAPPPPAVRYEGRAQGNVYANTNVVPQSAPAHTAAGSGEPVKNVLQVDAAFKATLAADDGDSTSSSSACRRGERGEERGWGELV